MSVSEIERKKALAGEMGKAICNLANIVEDWNDAQAEPDERGPGNGAIGLVVFDDGSGLIAEFNQGLPINDPLANGSVVHTFHNPEEAQDWFMDHLSARSLIGNGAGEDRLYKTAQTLLDLYAEHGEDRFKRLFHSLNILDACRQILVEGEGNPHPWRVQNLERSK